MKILKTDVSTIKIKSLQLIRLLKHEYMKFCKFLVFILLLTNCHQDNRTIGRQSLQELSVKYKGTEFVDSIKNYKFSMSIISQNNLEVQLWTQGFTSDTKKVLVFIYDKHGYAIPLLPNYYKRFWNFQFDDIQSDVTKIDVPFNHEFFKMLDVFGISDSVEIADECLISAFRIMDTRRLEISDSTELTTILDFVNFDIDESDSICSIRVKKSIEELYKSIQKSKHVHHFNAFWDQRNHRIYQIDFDSIRKYKTFTPCIKIYRFDCLRRLIEI